MSFIWFLGLATSMFSATHCPPVRSRDKEDGTAISWLQPVKNFMPKGLHTVLLAPGQIVRLEMYRFETSYDLLITSHTLVAEEGTPKPKLETRLIFFHRFGLLERELWDKDKMFR